MIRDVEKVVIIKDRLLDECEYSIVNQYHYLTIEPKK